MCVCFSECLCVCVSKCTCVCVHKCICAARMCIWGLFVEVFVGLNVCLFVRLRVSVCTCLYMFLLLYQIICVSVSECFISLALNLSTNHIVCLCKIFSFLCPSIVSSFVGIHDSIYLYTQYLRYYLYTTISCFLLYFFLDLMYIHYLLYASVCIH